MTYFGDSYTLTLILNRFKTVENMNTKLLRYKVINFRSIEESDWIEAGDNTCLVGTNEAGKTNLLIALWKLNPANDEPIVPLLDFPRHLYSKYKVDKHETDVFIKADFELSKELSTEIAVKCSCDVQQVRVALVQRKYDGKYYISLPYSKINSYPKSNFKAIIDSFLKELHELDAFIKEDEKLRNKIELTIKSLMPDTDLDELVESDFESAINAIKTLLGGFGKKQNLPELFNKKLLPALGKIVDSFNGKAIETTQEIRQSILRNMPKFVYYSDYGNLDSEIYLPRVIEDLKRDDLTESARAKARTLDVLFKYVKLSPQEIYQLGNDRKIVVKTLDYSQRVVNTVEENLSEEEVAEWAEKKKERGVLLRSAASELTKSFKQWWQQGNYIFSFEADGSHFRINVSDELRPESIELE